MPPPRPRPPVPIPEDVDTTRTLSFVNTLSGRPTSTPAERLITYDAFADWAREVGLLKPDDVERLAGRARRQSEDAARVLQRARELRERLHETFAATSDRRMPPPATLDALGTELSRWYPHGRLVPDGDRLQWAYARHGRAGATVVGDCPGRGAPRDLAEPGARTSLCRRRLRLVVPRRHEKRQPPLV